MITFPEHLAVHDIPHLGILFKRIRATRGLSQADIAQELVVTNSTISKFESTGRSRRAQIVDRYIHTLQSPSINNSQVPYPLDNDEAALLIQLNAEYHGGLDHALIEQLSVYDFDLIASPYSPIELKAMVQRLRQIRYPAYISDGLGFIHAMNSAMMNLFGIEPNSALLRNWESWHMLATNLTDPSPVRAAHVTPNHYLPSVIGIFFRHTLRYLFTPQMRALLRNLHQLSYLNGLNFSRWWYSASIFTLYIEQNESAYILRHGTRYLHTTMMGLECHWVHVATTMNVPYYLSTWQPLGAETQVIFEQLTGFATPGDVFFAAEFDRDRCHHVNCWPEVVQELQLAT